MLLGFTWLSAHAQVQRSGSDASRVMQQVQQITAERNLLKASNDDLTKQVADLKQQVDQLGKQRATLQGQLRNQGGATDQDAARANAAALEKSKGQLQELIGHFRETTATLAGSEAQRAKLQSEFDATKRDLGTCIEHNVGLYDVANAALDQLGKQTLWARTKETLSFTGIQRARLNNLIDDYRAQARDLKVEPGRAAAPASPTH